MLHKSTYYGTKPSVLDVVPLKVWKRMRDLERKFYLSRFWFWHEHEKTQRGYDSKWPTKQEYKIVDQRRLLHQLEMNRLTKCHSVINSYLRMRERGRVMHILRLYK